MTTLEDFSKVIKENKGREIVVEWQEQGSQKTLKAGATPRIDPPKNQGALGV
jgi:hypothetical protein